MPLFQSSVSSKYLKSLDKQAVQTAYGKFKTHFHNPTIQENIRNSKEEQYQGEFLIDLFVNVLGYTKNPAENYNLTTEYKNVKDSKKADGAIVVSGAVKAVIELKGTNVTDLGHVEVQAFSYKNNQPECVYVITSNFEKLRFYIDNAIENLEFNLFMLSEKDFELLYLCLAYSQIEKGIPKKIKDESISHEDDITKQLYRDYSLFKQELHADLVEKNPEYDTLLLFRKSQKLLSRFLFLFFAEDRQLLPPNSVRLILNDWRDLQERDVEIALYDRFKKYFEYLNTGFKGKRYDVFAYNGGLFKPDTVLDMVKIDDELLYRHTAKISDYDFASEVDVNILGHIFENSLNELDELTAQAAGQEIDKSKTKRKREGIVYTPKYITKYIVDNTVGRLCTDKKAELGIVEEEYYTDKKRSKKATQILFDKLKTYRNWLLQITICDPACGSGAFLNQALNFLIDEHRYIDELQAKLFGDSLVISDIENTILENNLFGVDLNEESVEIARLSLWLRTAQPNRKLNDLSNNIKCGNSLIDDPAIAGEKAFDWEKEFPQVFGREIKTDIIITPEKDESPDYLKLVQDKLLASQLKAEQALELSKEAIEISKEAYEYAQKLEAVSEPKTKYHNRKTGFDVVIGNPPYVQVNNSFYSNYETAKCGDLYVFFFERGLSILKQNGYFSFITPSLFIKGMRYEPLRNFLLKNTTIIEILDKGDKVFDEVQMPTAITTLINTKCENQDWNNYINNKDLIEKINSNSILIKDISKIMRGLEIGKNRVKNTTGSIQFLTGEDIFRYGIKSYSYIDRETLGEFSKDMYYFEGERVVIRETGSRIITIFLNDNVTNQNRSLYSIKINNEDFLPLYVLTILNSQIIQFYYQTRFAADTDIFPKIRMGQVKELPIKKISLSAQQPFIAKADQMLSLNKEFQEASGKFQRNLIREFSLETLSTKLQNWQSLSYAEFIKELEKQKIKLSLHQKAEWETYFQQEADKANTIKTEIDSTDREIDQMVYQLYGLTEEEIRIVEKK